VSEKVRLDTIGPLDDVETPQDVVFEEVELAEPSSETATESVQDVRP
jgi:hypothetical protein